MAESPNGFRILGAVSRVEVIASGRGVKRTIMGGPAMQKSTGSKRTALGGFAGKSSESSTANKPVPPRFVMCIDNKGYEGSLWIGKVYEVIRPEPNDAAHDLRVIDEEGEDYLYNAARFETLDLPPRAQKAVKRSRSNAASPLTTHN